ncbi:DUF177 domain-containing protein [Halodesulfovibrio aestuarii]|uniref:YceD family protein n=1 Tax=Halodesulfovibrio aestuarii TaxID=126333 RepID=UPI0035221022
MKQLWLAIKDLPPEGKEIIINDQSIWQGSIDEFALPYTIKEELAARLFLIPQEQGCILHGSMTGAVNLPCNRCTQDATISINQNFDEVFILDEELSSDDTEPNVRIANESTGIEIEVAGVLWEEFVIALPVKPLCKEDCKGLCAECGKDLNTGKCECEDSTLDPRFAVLRNLKVNK